MLDINLFRVEKGGDPNIVRESQRRRYAPVEWVDEVIQKDTEWRDGPSLCLCPAANKGSLGLPKHTPMKCSWKIVRMK